MNLTRTLTGLAVAATLTVVGCGGPATPAQTQTSTQSSTQTTGTSQPATTGVGTTTASQATAPAPGQSTDKAALLQRMAAAAGKLKTFTTTTEMTYQMGGAAMSTKAVMIIDQSDPAHIKSKMTATTPMGETVMMLDGATAYVQMGGTWFKMPNSSGTAAPTVVNPAEAMQELQGKISSATLIGNETVNGVATQHYRLVLDGSAFGELAGGAGTTPSPAVKITSFPYDMWVDAQGMPRKYAMDFSTSGNTFKSTGTFSNINEPVKLDFPTNAQSMPG